jgi:hypothetical protein
MTKYDRGDGPAARIAQWDYLWVHEERVDILSLEGWDVAPGHLTSRGTEFKRVLLVRAVKLLPEEAPEGSNGEK